MERMQTIYYCCIGVGLAIPLLDVLLGVFGGVFDIDFGFDGDLDFDPPVPVHIMSIAFTAVVFGAVGRLLLHRTGVLVSAAIALPVALVGGWAIGKFIIRPLKRSRPEAQGIQGLLGKEGVVKLEVRRDFVGTITVLSSIGSKVTYSARPSGGIEKIEVGKRVVIVGVDEKKRVCVVRPFEYERMFPED